MEKSKLKKKKKAKEPIVEVLLSRRRRFDKWFDRNQWTLIISLWSLMAGILLQKCYGGVRMKDDPKEYRYIMKCKDVQSGAIKWTSYDPDSQPYEIGDMFLVEGRNKDEELLALGPKEIVLEIRKLDEDGKVIETRK